MKIVHYSARMMDTATFCGKNAVRAFRANGDATYHHKYTSEALISDAGDKLCQECADRAPLIALAAASL